MSYLKKIKENMEIAAIELYSDKRLVVVDCRGIIDYSREFISLDLGMKRLEIRGRELVADSFSFGQTDIRGTIISLEFV